MLSKETPKRHHFVPQWYLEKFVESQSGFLHVYDKTTKTWRRQKPWEVMVINRYYRQEHVPQGIDPDILEKMFGSAIEPNGRNAFEKLLFHPQDFTAEDTAYMLVYIELQRIRVPRQIEMAKKLLRSALLLQAPPEAVSAMLRGEITIEISDSFRFNFMRTLTGSLNKYFARMQWTIIKAEDGGSFITSDNPVVFFNGDILPPLEAGIALVGTMVFFPLDPQHLLILQHPELLRDTKISRLEVVSEPGLEDGGIAVTQGIRWTKQQVEQHNWMTLVHSDRTIVGGNKEILQKAVDSDLNT